MSDDNKAQIDEAEKAVEQWKVKKLISTLEAARGNGTSMISLIIPPKDQISRVSKMLQDELGTATNIKCFGPGTKIMMYNGESKPVERIVDGDVLMGDDSTPRVVLSGSCVNGKDEMYEIISQKKDKMTWYCNQNHVLVLRLPIQPFMKIKADHPKPFHVLRWTLKSGSASDSSIPTLQRIAFIDKQAADFKLSSWQINWKPLEFEITVRDLMSLNKTSNSFTKVQMFQPTNITFPQTTRRQGYDLKDSNFQFTIKSVGRGTCYGFEVDCNSRFLLDDYTVVHNSRVNRLSVLNAIGSAQNRVKMYTRVPTNGLVVYCGTVVTSEGKEKRISIDFEPFKPINTSLYLCDNKFHTEALNELLESDDKFGFIIMDGNGALFGTLCGNTRTILYKFSVELPKKHGRGGQSALRFARLRLEKRHNYLRRVAETAVTMFITNDRPNVTGLILAGSAEFKTKLNASDLFDPRLAAIVQKVVDVSYGGENGFNQAIELAADCLANVKFIREKKLLSQYFGEIAKDSGKYCFGVKDTLTALESGAVEELIVWEGLEINRLVLKNKESGTEKIAHYTEKQEREPTALKEPDGSELEVIDKTSLLEWLATNFKQFGAKLQFITNKSQEGNQFCKGFGGIGGILRYGLDFLTMETIDDDDDDFM